MQQLAIVFAILTTLAPQTPGGIHKVSASDGQGTTASIAYRLRPSGYTGEADYGSVVSSGTLTIRKTGNPPVIFSLSSLGMTENPTIVTQDSCGAGAPLSFLRTSQAEYLVVESVIVGKGCAEQVHLIDLTTNALVPAIGLDHEFSHRNEIPLRYFREIDALRVTAIDERVISSSPPSGQPQIAVVQTVDSENRPSEFELDSVAALPLRGEVVSLGLLSGQRALRLSAEHERSWLALQQPTTRRADFVGRYNAYFRWSGLLAEQGRFSEALSAYEAAMAYLDDPRLFAGETSAIPKLRQLVRDVRSRKLSVAAAKTALV